MRRLSERAQDCSRLLQVREVGNGHPRLLPFALALLVCWIGSQSVWATDKCGAVCDETWNLAGSPYVVTCDVTVAAGCTLTIDAGVEVRFQSGTGLQVSGILDVNGASGSEVLLTSDAAVPAVGDWSGCSWSRARRARWTTRRSRGRTTGCTQSARGRRPR